MSRYIGLLFSIIAIGGCTYGQNDFNCSSGDENAMCASTRTIYKATDGDIRENETITYVKDGEKQQITLQELSDLKSGESKISENSSTSSDSNRVPFAFSYDGDVLRTDVKVLRIWIAPFIDEHDDLNLSTLVYTDIEKRKWQVGKKVSAQPQVAKSVLRSLPVENKESDKKEKKVYRPSESDVERLKKSNNSVQ